MHQNICFFLCFLLFVQKKNLYLTYMPNIYALLINFGEITPSPFPTLFLVMISTCYILAHASISEKLFSYYTLSFSDFIFDHNIGDHICIKIFAFFSVFYFSSKKKIYTGHTCPIYICVVDQFRRNFLIFTLSFFQSIYFKSIQKIKSISKKKTMSQNREIKTATVVVNDKKGGNFLKITGIRRFPFCATSDDLYSILNATIKGEGKDYAVTNSTLKRFSKNNRACSFSPPTPKGCVSFGGKSKYAFMCLPYMNELISIIGSLIGNQFTFNKVFSKHCMSWFKEEYNFFRRYFHTETNGPSVTAPTPSVTAPTPSVAAPTNINNGVRVDANPNTHLPNVTTAIVPKEELTSLERKQTGGKRKSSELSAESTEYESMELGRQDGDSSKRMKLNFNMDIDVKKAIKGVDYFEFQHFRDEVVKNVHFNNQLYQFFSNAPVTCQPTSSTGSSSTGSGDKRDGNHVVNQGSVSYTTEMMVSNVPEASQSTGSTGSTGSTSVTESIDLKSKPLEEQKAILARNNSLNEVILRCRGVERKAIVFKLNSTRVCAQILDTGEFFNIPYHRLLTFLGQTTKPHPYTAIRNKLAVGKKYSTSLGGIVRILKMNPRYILVRNNQDKRYNYPYHYFTDAVEEH